MPVYANSILNAEINARVDALDLGVTESAAGINFYDDSGKGTDFGRLDLNNVAFGSGGAQGIADVDSAVAAAISDNGSGKVRITSAGNFSNTLVGMYCASTFSATYTNNIYRITAVDASGNYIDIDLDYSTSTPTVGCAVGYQPAWPGVAWLNISTVPSFTPLANGNPGYCEFLDRDNNILWNALVGLTSGSEKVKFNSLNWETSVPVQLDNGYEQKNQGTLE